MHANVVFKNITEDNWVAGGKSGGFAYRNGKYMVVSINFLNDQSTLTYVLVHEWAHLWMFNNSKQFKSAVMDFYKSKLQAFKQDANVNNAEFKFEFTR